MFGLRLPWTAAPGVQPANARRPRQSPRAVLSHDRRSGSPPMPPGRRAPPPEAAGEDRGAAAEGMPDALAQAMEGAFSANTKRALKADLRIYTAWCAEEGREALPATPDTVAAFVDAMAATRAPATVRRYVASIAMAHRATGSPEAQRSPAVTLALKRMHRDRGRRQAQAPALTWPLRQRLVEAAGDRPIDTRNRALLALAYDTMLRRSELVALRVRDLAVDRTTGAATVLVRNSKTDAEGEGAVLYVAPDTMALVAEWLELSGVADGRLFRSLCRGRLGEALDPSQIPRIYKAMARRAGIEAGLADRLSGHSPRVGAAQDMVAYGIGLPAIQQAGRWKSPDMVHRYGERLLAGRSAAAQLARMQGRDGPDARPSPPAPGAAVRPVCGLPERGAQDARRRQAPRRAAQHRARPPAPPPERERRERQQPAGQPCAPDPAAQPQPGLGKRLPETPAGGRPDTLPPEPPGGRRDEPAADPVLRRHPGARQTPRLPGSDGAESRLQCGDPRPVGRGHDLLRLRQEPPDPVPLLRHADAVAWPGRRIEHEISTWTR